MTRRCVVRLTRNAGRNLQDIEAFLLEAQMPQVYDELLDELLDVVIPNLERFPAMGRPLHARPAGSVEGARAMEDLRRFKVSADVRELVTARHLVLYARVEDVIHLLSIRQHRQISFDFEGLWPPA